MARFGRTLNLMNRLDLAQKRLIELSSGQIRRRILQNTLGIYSAYCTVYIVHCTQSPCIYQTNLLAERSSMELIQ